MNFLNLSKRKVEFVFFELDMWLNRNKLDSRVEVICSYGGLEYYRINVFDISTFHHSGSTRFYCGENFEFFVKCSSEFDLDPEVSELYFKDTSVSRNRIDRLVNEIERRKGDDQTSSKFDGLNFWKAEQFGVAELSMS